jgi:integrase
MARPRTKNPDLPPNLYRYKKGGRFYFQYRHPVKGTRHAMGSDRNNAIQAARHLNNKLTPLVRSTAHLIARVEQPKDTVAEYAEHFREVLKEKRNRRGKALSPRTLDEYERQLRALCQVLGHRGIADVNRRHISLFLESFAPTHRNRVRSLMRQLFARAVGEGLIDSNPVDGTLKADEVIQRKRLTLEDFQRVREHADLWLKCAMDLGLHTLQRRSDLVNVKYPEGFYLYIVQQKTGQRIRIRLTPELEQVIQDSCDAVKSDYIIHKDQRKGRTQVSPDQVTRAFAEARDEAGVGADLKPEERPTFHEIRALGAKLYEAAGIDPQALLGHIDPQTTRTYLDRHKVKWTEVEAGLKLPG